MQRIYCLCWSYGVNVVFLSLLFLKGNKNVPRMNVYSYIVTLLYFFLNLSSHVVTSVHVSLL